jgi:hypothetical protein
MPNQMLNQSQTMTCQPRAAGSCMRPLASGPGCRRLQRSAMQFMHSTPSRRASRWYHLEAIRLTLVARWQEVADCTSTVRLKPCSFCFRPRKPVELVSANYPDHVLPNCFSPRPDVSARGLRHHADDFVRDVETVGEQISLRLRQPIRQAALVVGAVSRTPITSARRRQTDRERRWSWFCTQMARPERFERPTLRFVV